MAGSATVLGDHGSSVGVDEPVPDGIRIFRVRGGRFLYRSCIRMADNRKSPRPCGRVGVEGEPGFATDVGNYGSSVGVYEAIVDGVGVLGIRSAAGPTGR